MQGIEDQYRKKQNPDQQDAKAETKTVPDVKEQLMDFIKAAFGNTVEIVDGKAVLKNPSAGEAAESRKECGFSECRPPYRKFSESENRMIPCSCGKYNELEEYQNRQKIRTLGIPDKYIGSTFADIITQGEPGEFASIEQAMDLAKRMINTYRKSKGSGIVFTGQKGTGKTMLSSIILQEIYSKYNANVYFVNFDKYIDNVRESMTKGTRMHGKEFELQEKLFRQDLLCIDEIGVGRQSEFKLQKLYAVINERYEKQRPTIVTTNISMSEISRWEYGRIHSRFTESYYIVEMTGADFRKKLAKSA